MITYPFHYEVRFKLLAFVDQNKINPQFVNKTFKESEPIINRNKAFEAFEVFLSYKENQLTIRSGNYFIKQPIFIRKEINKIGKTIDRYLEWKFEKFEKFKEEFEIYLIIDDKDKLKEVYDGIDTELLIHSVASYGFDPQDILDNLMYEFIIYNNYGYETNNKKITVEHYGTDYFEGGQHPALAFVDILKTPFHWYSDKEKEDEEHRKFQLIHSEESPNNLIEGIIEQGETNSVEFKSSLLFNFKTGKAGASIKYKIARTICGFLNSNGGLLFIGVRDDKEIQGLDFDFSLFDKDPKDQFRKEFDSLIKYYFPLSIIPVVITEFTEINGKEIFLIQIEKNPRPVFLNNQYINRKEFFVRLEASTREITDIEEIIDYIFNNWINQKS